METEQIRQIISAVKTIAAQKTCPVIGIDGLGGAGKSTISEEIQAELERNGLHTVLLHIDDFIHVKAIRYNSSYPEWMCYYHLQWRYAAFLELIGEIRHAHGEVTAELYDKEHDCYIHQALSVQPDTVILTEGIFLQRQELHGVFDYMVYMDVPESERLARVLKRDLYIGNADEIRKKYENRYFPAERFYYSEYRPDLSANVTIGG